MEHSPLFLDLKIKMEALEFCKGFSKFATIRSKVLIGALILWAVF